MKRLLFIPVNYNSYDCLQVFLESIETSAKALSIDEIKIDIMVADNSTKEEVITFPSDGRFGKSKQLMLSNKGYFGGAFFVYNSLDKKKYDYVIISNVDLKVREDFLRVLLGIEYPMQIGWLAPSIFSKQENRDMNPKIANRYSKRAVQILRIMYKYPLLKKLYTNTLYKRKRGDCIQTKDKYEIYAGHGAMFIMTKAFVDKNPTLEYPVFLYGEEIFMGEMVRLSGLKTIYIPTLVVNDDAHVSTSAISGKRNRKYNVEALTYILKTFYE